MARSTLANLIQQVRDMTDAGTAVWTQGTANMFDDDHVQAILDRNRREIDGFQLEPVPVQSAGSVTWTDYRACYDHRSECKTYRNWETTDGGTAVFIVRDSGGAAQGGYTSDYGRGLVTFTTNRQGTAYYLSGRIYDLYGAAADLLGAWAAHELLSFDVRTPGGSFSRSQKATALQKMADNYRQQAWGDSVSLLRGDVADWNEGPRYNHPIKENRGY